MVVVWPAGFAQFTDQLRWRESTELPAFVDEVCLIAIACRGRDSPERHRPDCCERQQRQHTLEAIQALQMLWSHSDDLTETPPQLPV